MILLTFRSMPYPMPPIPTTPVPAQSPSPAPHRDHGRSAARSIVRICGWVVVAGLVVFSGVLVLSWDRNSQARSADLRVASVESAAATAHSLKRDEVAPVPAADPNPESLAPPIENSLASSPAPVAPEVPALKEWPRAVTLSGTPDVKTVSENPATREFVYHTDHFEFSCDMPVGPDTVRHFARVFEATWLLNCMIPLDLRPTPETMRKWFRARILSSNEAYMATGAPAGSGGYYSRADKTIYVPISSLGMKVVGDKRVMVDRSVESNGTLIHEITHQMMGHWLPKLPVWFVEGAAEYTGIADFVHSRFFLSGMEARLKSHLRIRGGKAGGGSIHFRMLRLPELLALDRSTWANDLAGDSAAENYTSSLLLTFYLYHLDRNGDTAGTIAWLRAIEQGRSSTEGFREHILAGRTLAQFEADFIVTYRKLGIEFEFARRGGPEFE